ncbi:MAG: OmpA family protein [Thiotrichales bacterium]|nr:OmpA family protein [Thiotrichales bacterium]
MFLLLQRSRLGRMLFRSNSPLHITPVWLLVYIGLFTSLLAVFLFIISWMTLEQTPPNRAYQAVLSDLYQRSMQLKNQQQLDWLRVENTHNKGIKFSLDYRQLDAGTLFDASQAHINPPLVPYLQTLASLLVQLDLPLAPLRYQPAVQTLASAGLQMQWFIRVEGHTDAHPIPPGTRFANNVELSSYRAYSVMEFLRLHSRLPSRFFMIAGYGEFQPMQANPFAAQNRRVEIYLLPKLSPLPDSVQGAFEVQERADEHV